MKDYKLRKVICIKECTDIYSSLLVCRINKIYTMGTFRAHEEVNIYLDGQYLGLFDSSNFMIYSEYLENLIKEILE